jgi:hypothetical protein
MKKIIFTAIAMSFFSVSVNAQLWKQEAKGYFTGRLGNYPFVIEIQSIYGKNVYGYSIVKGNKRFFNGKITGSTSKFLNMTLIEPGDRNGDGIFEVSYSRNGIIEGNWTQYGGKPTYEVYVNK